MKRAAGAVQESEGARVEWTATARKQVLPRRGDTATKPLELDRAKLFGKFSKAIGSFKRRRSTGELDRVLDAAVTRHRSAKEPAGELDPFVEAAALLVAQEDYRQAADESARVAASYWIAARGVAFAIEALGRTLGYRIWDGALVPAECGPQFPGGLAAFRVIRQALATADDASYAEARAAAARVRERLAEASSAGARVAVGFAFPGEQDWHRADADLVQQTWWSNEYWALIASLADEERLVRLVEQRKDRLEGSDHFVWREFIYCVLDVLGPRAFGTLSVFADSVLTRAEDKKRTATAISLIVSAEVAGWMASKVGDPCLGRAAEAYLAKHAALGIPALRRALPHAGRKRALLASVLDALGKDAAVAIGDGKRAAAEAERAEAPARSVAGLPPELVPPNAERILPPDYYFSRPVSRVKLRLRATGEPLAADGVELLAKWLAPARFDALPPALDRFSELLTPESVSEYAWALFRLFERDEMSTKEQGPMIAVALWGGDGTDAKLIERVKEWLFESRRGWAGLAFDALGRIGTPAALAYLERQSNKASDPSLRKRARAALDRLGAASGLSRAELSDTLVPSFGLGPARTRVLEYAGRRIEVGFTADLRPRIVDEQGERCSRLPRPSGHDAAVEAAQSTWEALRKDVERTAREQSRRLEQAMCARQTWRLERVHAMLSHPILGSMATRLVWTTTAAPGLRFRIAEDGSLADVRDQPLTVAPAAEVAIPHPLLLSAKERAAWTTLLADYEVVPPFEQMARALYEPTEKESSTSRLDRVKGCRTARGRMYALTHRGWKNYEIELVRPLQLGDGRPAVVILEVEDEKLGSAVLYQGKDEFGKRVPFSQLEPIAFSELVRDLLAAKAD